MAVTDDAEAHDPLIDPAIYELPATEVISSRSPEVIEHWLSVYTDLVRTEEWLLDDTLPDSNILRIRLERLKRLRDRQEFWRRRRDELEAAGS